MMSDNPLPDIGISYDQRVPDEIISELSRAITHDQLSLRVESRPPDDAYAALEWLLPTAIVIFFGKSYFDAFLKEAGKDHYNLVKAGLASLSAKVFGKDRKLRFQIRGPNKKAHDRRSVSVRRGG